LYFGRHIQKGEAEEDISKEGAIDFDNSLKLAKTISILAFFAFELCYTDLDVK
jgi:hypothetical protein